MALFDEVGGAATFERLIDLFYAAVERDALLRPMYPADLAASKRHLALFLMQYWGGPQTYVQERGHPRLRMRHLPFAVTRAARDAWVQHMDAALDALALPPEQDAAMRRYFADAATFMINNAG